MPEFFILADTAGRLFAESVLMLAAAAISAALILAAALGLGRAGKLRRAGRDHPRFATAREDEGVITVPEEAPDA